MVSAATWVSSVCRVGTQGDCGLSSQSSADRAWMLYPTDAEVRALAAGLHE